MNDLIQNLCQAILDRSEGGDVPEVFWEAQAWLKNWSGEQTIVSLPPRIKPKPCNRCDDPIFFVYDNTRWIPFIPYGLSTSDMVLDGVLVDFSTDPVKGGPGAVSNERWFPHRLLCGVTTRPDDPYLGIIWDKTCKNRDLDPEEASRELRSTILSMDDE